MDTVTHFYSKPAKYHRGQDADESRSDAAGVTRDIVSEKGPMTKGGKMNKDINVSYASKATKQTSDVTANATAKKAGATVNEIDPNKDKIVFKTE